jgi:hypothetical protein
LDLSSTCERKHAAFVFLNLIYFTKHDVFSGDFLIRTLVPLWPSWSWKFYLLTPSQWELSFSVWISREDINIQSIAPTDTFSLAMSHIFVRFMSFTAHLEDIDFFKNI